MAALYYAMLKRDSKEYKKLAQNLFRTGEYSIGKYIIKPHEKAGSETFSGDLIKFVF